MLTAAWLCGGPYATRPHAIRLPVLRTGGHPADVCERPPGGVWLHFRYDHADDHGPVYQHAGECAGIHPDDPPDRWPIHDPDCPDLAEGEPDA